MLTSTERVAPEGAVRGEPGEPAPAVTVRSVTKVYGQGPAAVTALDGIDLTIRPGELVTLLGASGCGKSTLLNLLAGLDRPTAGTVEVPDGVGLMFQESALFPWLTVRRNVETALRLRGVPRRERRERATDLLAAVRLQDFAEQRPHELSGGMRQRAALARALAQDAPLLLMDEPFGALDAITREVLQDELEREWQSRHLTIVLVTHDVREAVRLGDRVVLLSSRPGRVVADVAVDLERPRRLERADVAAVAADVTERLHREVRRHARR